MQSSVVTWYTQPDLSFASFYYYDKNSKDLVRIRMELGRTDKNNETFVIYTNNRYVGFDKDWQSMLDAVNTNKTAFTVAPDDSILFGQVKLPRDPAAGLNVCDFTGKTPANSDVHIGNAVTAQGPSLKLPPGLAEPTLKAVAQKAIAKKQGRILTPANAQPKDLTTALEDAAKNW